MGIGRFEFEAPPYEKRAQSTSVGRKKKKREKKEKIPGIRWKDQKE